MVSRGEVAQLARHSITENGRLLIVDDNTDYLRTLEMVLDGTGHECRFYSNGPAAIDAAASDEFDVLLTDVRMLPLDGVETARTIKQVQPLLAVIMMTGFDKEDTPLEALRLGAVDFIDKPITDIDAFLRLLTQQVRLVHSAKQLVSTKQRLETVLSIVDAGIVVIDPAGEIEGINPLAHSVLAPGAGEVVGRPFVEVCRIPELHALAAQQDSITRTFERSVGGGRPRLFQVDATPLVGAPGQPPGVVLLIKDLTSIAEAQKAKGWRQMSQAITHGMKTPLATLRMRLEGLISSAQDAQKKTENERLLRIVEELHGRLRDLVDLAKLEIAALSVDINESVQAVVRQLETHRAPTTQFDVRLWPEAIVVPHSPSAVRLALENLFSNAQESVPGGPVSIELSTRLADDGGAEITLADNGPGIPAEQREQIFERPLNSTKVGGSGMGAALVKYIVEGHRGRLSWESPRPELGHGTRVTLHLPAATGRPREGQA
ncbi:MAG: response regulator [Pirellulales bacterium]